MQRYRSSVPASKSRTKEPPCFVDEQRERANEFYNKLPHKPLAENLWLKELFPSSGKDGLVGKPAVVGRK